MNSASLMLSNDSLSNSVIQNKRFSILHDTLTQNGWKLVVNEMYWINYTKEGDETSYFDIQVTQNKIMVSVPIKNSIYQYTTSFTSYYEASEFLEKKMYEYN